MPGFCTQVLRGVGQVVFQANPWTGAAFAVALCMADWRYAAYALGGAALGTSTARWLGVPRDRQEAGLEGFNSALLALCLAVLLGQDRPATALLAAAGCVVVTVGTAAAVRLLSVWDLPPLTLPYCLLAVAVNVAAPAFRRIQPYGDGLAALPGSASGPTALHLPHLARAFLHNVSQLFFLERWHVGALLLAGVFLASRTAGLIACAGSVTGIVTAWALGAPAERIADGTMGYNAVLVALALCGVFLPAAPATLLYALLGAATATALTPAIAALLAPSGGRAFTWPFVLTTLGFLAAARAFPRLTGPHGWSRCRQRGGHGRGRVGS
ncbi:urea transporter [Streptomyces sp. SID5910]|uniref:urea transporter n=1 Tax=Streptomyces sp. SID5910 TaxID=2690312 RepID=UPI00136BF704|nr:urea transporter [Streptomyces sp. SID5910]MYR47010.1 urea transporter [Streptomyces sp. SID5910]